MQHDSYVLIEPTQSIVALVEKVDVVELENKSTCSEKEEEAIPDLCTIYNIARI